MSNRSPIVNTCVIHSSERRQFIRKFKERYLIKHKTEIVSRNLMLLQNKYVKIPLLKYLFRKDEKAVFWR